jgi:hypothetical protein
VRSHAWIDRRSAALHEAVAARLEARPDLLEVARRNLSRWLETSPSGALREWQQLLDQSSMATILQILRSADARAVWLRQSSPFAGVLSRSERDAILHRYDPRRT